MPPRPYVHPHFATILRTVAAVRSRAAVTDGDLHRLVDACARGAGGAGDPEVRDVVLRLTWITRVAATPPLTGDAPWALVLADAGAAAVTGVASPVLQALPWLGGTGLEGMLRRALAQGVEAVERVQDGRAELVCPDDVPPHLAQRCAAVWDARTLLDRKRWPQAARAATRALEAVGWDGQAFAHRAAARLEAGDAAGACADAEELLGVACVEAALQIRGRARERLGRDPGSAAHALRGATAVWLQRDAEAVVCFKKALLSCDRDGAEVGFDELEACLAFAAALARLGRHEGAAEAAARAVARDPRCTAAWLARWQALRALGDDAGVAGLLDACIEAGAADWWTWLDRAQGRLARGELAAAWPDAQRAVAEYPALVHDLVSEARYAPLRALPEYQVWLGAALARAPAPASDDDGDGAPGD